MGVIRISAIIGLFLKSFLI
uniref:Uncharacterized protein n=1 Tax=Moniliophthora roreri TaxID=221103 RepID=A0A0W0FTI7_MONRR